MFLEKFPYRVKFYTKVKKSTKNGAVLAVPFFHINDEYLHKYTNILCPQRTWERKSFVLSSFV